jgi:hypothetical protein
MWNKVTEAEPKATLIWYKQLLLPFLSVQFIMKAWLLFQGIGEARSQFHPAPLKSISWVTMGIKEKEKKNHILYQEK